MRSIVQSYLQEVRLGRKQSYRNLAMYPLLSAYSATLEYKTLDEALAEDLIEVREKDEAGSVPELKVVNSCPSMVLILDGEELVGAKQNRIVNTTILIKANSCTVIPVSCVEQGRWAYERPRFYSKERLLTARLRAMKVSMVHRSIRTRGTFHADQARVWAEISSKAERMEAESPTMAMARIYEKKQSPISDYVAHFRTVPTQAGAVFLINGKIVGLDSFGKRETFAKVFKKLLESYALDAIDWLEGETTRKVLKGNVAKFLQAAAGATVEARPVGWTGHRLPTRIQQAHRLCPGSW